MSVKKIGSISVAALLLASAPAWAYDDLNLDLGGYFVGALSSVDGDTRDVYDLDPDTDSTKFAAAGQIYVTGTHILDNGIRLGFKAALNLNSDSQDQVGGMCGDFTVDAGYLVTCQDRAQEVYIFVETGFGRFELGQQDGVGEQFSLTSPRALTMHSVNDRQDRHQLNPVGQVLLSTINDSSGDQAKINYLTPKVGPVQLGISYTPEGLGDTDMGYTSAQKKAYDEIWEVGLAIDEMIQDVRLKVGATYVTANNDTLTWDNKEWNVGVNVGFGGFTVGGSYRDSEGLTIYGDGNEYTAWDAGLAYETGAWKFSGQYGQQEGGVTVNPDLVDGDTYLLSARYNVTEGFRVGAGFQHDEADDTGEDGSALILETALKF
ncbi:MAG: porin [Alphaproteobacteria bacterium]|nr:MAG: porin [Alphaproteobacteria bacterium]